MIVHGMKHNKRIIEIGILGLVLSAAVFGEMNCAGFKTDAPSIESNQLSSADTKVEPPVGLMSSEQILKAMISATGTEGLGELTDPADDAINNTYMVRSGSLPSVQNLSQATGPTQISVTNLASTVCAKAVDRDRGTSEAQKAERLFFREMNFSLGLSGQSSDAVSMAFERLARNAWRRDVTSIELEEIILFAQEFSLGANATDVVQTRHLAVAVCTAVLSSIDSITY